MLTQKIKYYIETKQGRKCQAKPQIQSLKGQQFYKL